MILVKIDKGVMYESNLPYPVVRGKVRDNYDISELMGFPTLLIVATDRVSAFDVVSGDPIQYKGVVLTQMTLFWLEYLNFSNHLLTATIDYYPKELQKYRDQLMGRSMIVRIFNIFPLECIVRGYLTGSGKEDYNEIGKVDWHELPKWLVEASEIDPPIFTPSTKAEIGKHDKNIYMRDDAVSILVTHFSKKDFACSKKAASDLLEELEEISIYLYSKAAVYAENRGIIIADTKFELAYNVTFGGSGFILCDEVLTPDSSRFWSKDQYKEGVTQPSFDKQYVRDYLKSLGWSKKSGIPMPKLPEDVKEKTTEKYIQAYEMLTGKKFNF